MIVLVCLVVFGPQGLPEMARQAGCWLAQARMAVQRCMDELKTEADLKDLDLPDLRLGSLRQQARDYVGKLLDIEGQMAELQPPLHRLRRQIIGIVEWFEPFMAPFHEGEPPLCWASPAHSGSMQQCR